MKNKCKAVLLTLLATVSVGLSSCKTDYSSCEFIGSSGTKYIWMDMHGALGQGFRFDPDGTGKWAAATTTTSIDYPLTYTLTKKEEVYYVTFQVEGQNNKGEGYFAMKSGRRAFIIGESVHYAV